MLTRLLDRLRQHRDARRRERPGRIPVVFYFVAGVVFSFAALGGSLEAYGLRHGEVTSGTVVERDNGGKVPTVTLRFEVPGHGEVVCITDTFREDAEAGQVTQVRYDADDPEENCSTGEHGGYGGFALGVVVALSLLANGERLRRRRRRLLALDDHVCAVLRCPPDRLERTGNDVLRHPLIGKDATRGMSGRWTS